MWKMGWAIHVHACRHKWCYGGCVQWAKNQNPQSKMNSDWKFTHHNRMLSYKIQVQESQSDQDLLCSSHHHSIGHKHSPHCLYIVSDMYHLLSIPASNHSHCLQGEHKCFMDEFDWLFLYCVLFSKHGNSREAHHINATGIPFRCISRHQYEV